MRPTTETSGRSAPGSRPVDPGLHRRFLEELRASGVANPEGASVAVLCTLDRRVFGAEGASVPLTFRALFWECEPHRRSPRREGQLGRGEFCDTVAEHLGRDRAAAERIIVSVFAAAHALLSRQDARELASLLPSELRVLWERPLPSTLSR